MLRKLYTNSGLILLAALCAGVWFSNIRSLYQPKNTAPVAVAAPAPSPSPTAELTSDEFMKQRQQGATARCKDGTFSYSAKRRKACSGHGGVAQWLSR